MYKVIITMPASIQKDFPAAARQMIWQPGRSVNTGKRRFCFLQLGWSGGKWAKFHKYDPVRETIGIVQPFIVR